MHIDHIRPKAIGGSDSAANLRPTHSECNLRRRNPRDLRYRRFVLTLPTELVDKALDCAHREDLQLLTWIEEVVTSYVEVRQRQWVDRNKGTPN